MRHETFMKFLLLFCFSAFIIPYSFSSPEDSAVHKKPSTRNDTWFNNAEPEQRFVIDSTILHFEEYNLVQRDGKEYMNLGNAGTAAYPLIFDMNRSIGFNAGYNQFDLYRYQKDSVRY